ncbi:MAG: ABC transporter ATP-binding protein [Planctomycetota bacterium]|jgi:ABC-type lipoprotein export system ATPase subunit
MIRLEDVLKTYQTRSGLVKALDGINLNIEKGEFIVVSGPSGSGKTTLLMTLAAMQRPTAGTVTIEQKNIYAMSTQDRAKFRARNIGFVFQMFHLIPYLNILENIVLAGRTPTDKNKKAHANELIEKFGLIGRAYHKPPELSAGEKQRTAIARALLNKPAIVLADEPTGNLDSDNTASVLGHLSRFHQAGGTVILATHATVADNLADRVIYLKNGRIDNPPSA